MENPADVVLQNDYRMLRNGTALARKSYAPNGAMAGKRKIRIDFQE